MSFQSFKVLTFDVVGTLIDFESGVLDAVRRIGGRSAERHSDTAIFDAYIRGRDRNRGRSSDVFGEVYRAVAAELDLPSDARAAEAFQLSVLRWQPFADSVEALARLRRRFRLVAMTNADRTAFSAYEQALGRPFHDSVTADDTGTAKPDPRYFAYNQGRQAAFGYAKSEILHVAQSQYHDIGVARAEGYTVCWIERRQGQEGFGATPVPETVTKPDFHFPTLKALADAIDAAG
ncbi:HAD-IA family hydrolase [Marinivivus vitaminiproducens]|uniref:HAD-IA family hydrolase n=1 Tax=Marinivivus vitaminiproducens TaxID=3035935 RepID=UPI0027AAEE74|nr:HAD-IA family hydrolase [Geminicoccaceae bacterium SCSIO 64248]